MEKLELATFFKGKKVFITGHTGFKGGWLLLLLEELGAKVYGYSLPPEKDSIFNVLSFSCLQSSGYADILDNDKLEEEINTVKPDLLIHLAAQSLVLESYENPVYTFEVNSLGTANVLNAIKKLTAPCAAIIVTTDKVYVNKNQKKPFKEDDPLGGNDPYSASKAAAELISHSFRESFFNPTNYVNHGKSIATARSGNVIGGGDWASNRIIPDIVRSIATEEKVELRNPSSTRPWQHVLEPLMGYLKLAYFLMKSPSSDLFCSSWNFGPINSHSYSVKELTQEIIKEWGNGQFEESKLTKNKEAKFLEIDSEKALLHLSWKPKLDFQKSVSLTALWYKHYLANRNDMTAFTKNQINEYLDSI